MLVAAVFPGVILTKKTRPNSVDQNHSPDTAAEVAGAAGNFEPGPAKDKAEANQAQQIMNGAAAPNPA